MTVFETSRLLLRRLSVEDAPFVLELVNDPDWLRFIGDKKVRTLMDACRYLLEGPVEMYRRRGHGLYAIELKASGVPIGVCGLIKRDGLDDVDLGFALLPAYRGLGYAYEAAVGTLHYAREELGLPRVVAITTPANDASAKLLRKLGLRFDFKAYLDGEQVDVFATPEAAR